MRPSLEPGLVIMEWEGKIEASPSKKLRKNWACEMSMVWQIHVAELALSHSIWMWICCDAVILWVQEKSWPMAPSMVTRDTVEMQMQGPLVFFPPQVEGKKEVEGVFLFGWAFFCNVQITLLNNILAQFCVPGHQHIFMKKEIKKIKYRLNLSQNLNLSMPQFLSKLIVTHTC